MRAESGGALTAIFMLIPLVAVPYFAIRGTTDFDKGKAAAEEAAEGVEFKETPEFSELGKDSEFGGDSEAPPFPTDDAVVVKPDPDELSDPFGENTIAKPDVSFGGGAPNLQAEYSAPDIGSDLGAIAGGFDEPAPTPAPKQRRGGLGSANVRSSGSGMKARTVSQTQALTKKEWDAAMVRLERLGMRNYRVESTRDKKTFFVTAFLGEPQSSVTTRLEGSGSHPVLAIQDVLQQAIRWDANAQR